MKKILYTLVLLCLLFTSLNAIIIEAPNLEPFENELTKIDQHSFVLFDVDETLLIPKDLILNRYARNIWDHYAKKTVENPLIVPPGRHGDDYFLGQILSKIEYEVVDSKVVEIIHNLQQQQIKAIAFTRMNTGSLGAVRSMEDWRIEHLKKHGIDFSPAFPVQEVKIDVIKSSGKSSLYKQGLLCANRQDKGPVLMVFFENIKWKPSKVLFIDNNLDYLKSVETALEGTGIQFIGFHYTEVESRPIIINERLAEFQLMHLAKTGEWLSDSEALELMK